MESTVILVNPIIYLKTARTYAALASSMHSQYYVNKAKEQLTLFHYYNEKMTATTIEFKFVA